MWSFKRGGHSWQWSLKTGTTVYIYVNNMANVKSVRIFRLYFGKIHSFAPDFISEESFRPEEFFEVLF